MLLYSAKVLLRLSAEYAGDRWQRSPKRDWQTWE